jgi:hypothetical protein
MEDHAGRKGCRASDIFGLGVILETLRTFQRVRSRPNAERDCAIRRIRSTI